MQRKKPLLEELTAAGAKSQYDEHVKRILSNREVMSRILKAAVEEYRDCQIAEIAESLGQRMETGRSAVRPGYCKRQTASQAEYHILGDSNEDKIPGEGTIYYDIRFRTFVPGNSSAHPVRLLINVEAQKKFYQKYHFVTRGIFYAARMISGQLDTEFTASDYDNIKKVYSIWICMNAPKKIGNAMAEYSMTKKDMIGHIPDLKSSYDKLTVIMICLREDIPTQEKGLHRLLNTLLSGKLSVAEKMKILSQEYGMKLAEQLEKEMNEMCNLSDLIEERGLKEGRKEGKMDKTKIVVKNMLLRGMSDEDIRGLAECSQKIIDEVRGYIM